jgi:CTP:molybdopterin cytidylyltransferase MocA
MPHGRAAGPLLVPARLHAIILAAGAATRFGAAKQLLHLDGEPLLRTVVNRAAQVVGNAWHVVLGARASELAARLEVTPDHIVTNQDWPEGIGSSIRTGVASLPPDCEGVLLLLADQAAVTVEDLVELVSAWRRQPSLIAAARYEGATGVPALFPRAYFPDLLQLKGDTGARKLLKENPDRVLPVPMPHAGVDIDTPEDARRFQESVAARTR